MPQARAPAILLFGTALGLLMLGGAFTNGAIVSMGGALMLFLCAAYAHTAPLSRRVRRERLEFAWWLAAGDHEYADARVGRTLEIHGYLRNRGTRGITTRLRPVAPRELTPEAPLNEQGERLVPLERSSRTDVHFAFTARSAGHHVLPGLRVGLHGIFGLFEIQIYFAHPISIQVLPASVARRAGAFGPPAGTNVERVARTVVRQRGSGTEIRELRDHQPGDAFRSIAWKASARANKLLVRDVERDVQQTIAFVIDAAPSTRAGELGERTLDWAAETAAREAQAALGRGDQVALLTVDRRVISRAQADDGARHIFSIYDAILSAFDVVDEDLTSSDEDDLIERVGRYVRVHEGLDFARDGSWDVLGLVKHVLKEVGHELAHHDGRRGSAGDSSASSTGQSKELGTSASRAGSDGHAGARSVVATSITSAALRRYCRKHGIPIPYRIAGPSEDRFAALRAAVRDSSGSRREPRTFIWLTDLETQLDRTEVERTLSWLRRGGHRLVVMTPPTTEARAVASFASKGAPPLDTDATLARAYAASRRARQEEAVRVLRPMGVRVVREPQKNP